MSRAEDWCLTMVLGSCRAIAPLLAVTDAVLRPRRTRRAWLAFRAGGARPARALRDIWFSRVAREALAGLLAAGMRRALLARVVLLGNTRALDRGAVLATCHSPWGRLLAAWIARDGRVALLATRRWLPRAAGAHEPADRGGMRRALGRLGAGRCVAVTVDHFERGACEANVLRRPVRACLGAARLAARARVPLVPVVARHVAGRIEITLGDAIPVTPETVGEATAAAIAVLDREFRRDPSAWADALRFAST